jgi:hypothetical protein
MYGISVGVGMVTVQLFKFEVALIARALDDFDGGEAANTVIALHGAMEALLLAIAADDRQRSETGDLTMEAVQAEVDRMLLHEEGLAPRGGAS